MVWIIEHKIERDDETGKPLAWSNNCGWGSGDFDTFTDKERASLILPVDGEWAILAATSSALKG